MNQFLDFYTTYVSPVVYIILFITIIITSFYLVKMLIQTKKLAKTMNIVSVSQESLQEKLNTYTKTKNDIDKYYRKKKDQLHLLLSAIFFLKFLEKNKGEK
ncbi:MAG: hypothetical protein ACK5L6_03720 [Anaerorhabdus sp.]|uniref:hypothetical protein n=1 Tax=Anaerorhabdus sp. TaxID=1872524 RepID=UPI003A8BECA5